MVVKKTDQCEKCTNAYVIIETDDEGEDYYLCKEHYRIWLKEHLGYDDKFINEIFIDRGF